MTDLVKFWIGADLVVSRVRLTPKEIAYGYWKGWIDAADVVAIAVDKMRTGPVSLPEEQLAPLLSDQLR